MMNLIIEKSEEKFRTFANFTHDWEYWIAPDGNYIYISPSVQVITGYSVKEFFQDKDIFKKIIHPDDFKEYDEHRRNREINPVEEKHTNFRIITKSGKEIWINHVCNLVYGKNKIFLGVRGSNRDISKELTLLNQLTKTNNELIK